jgi:hypothetical protein
VFVTLCAQLLLLLQLRRFRAEKTFDLELRLVALFDSDDGDSASFRNAGFVTNIDAANRPRIFYSIYSSTKVSSLIKGLIINYLSTCG